LIKPRNPETGTNEINQNKLQHFSNFYEENEHMEEEKDLKRMNDLNGTESELDSMH